MKIKAYRSNKYQNWDIYETDAIWGTLEPEEMSSADIAGFAEGKLTSMCNFDDADGTWHCIPWPFIISITEE